MMKNLLKPIFFLSVIAGLSACETPLTVQKLPDITFSNLPPISLNVERIETISEFKAPLKLPNVDHLFYISPEKALMNWGRDRLAATGKKGQARFVIKNAAATESKLAIDKGFAGQFKKELSERYTVLVEGELQIIDASGVRVRAASAKAERSRTILEDASLNERKKLWHDITRAAVTDFNSKIESVIKTHFSGVLN